MTQKWRSIAFTWVLESVSYCTKQSPSVFLSLLSAFFCMLTHSPTSFHTYVQTHTRHLSLLSFASFFSVPPPKKMLPPSFQLLFITVIKIILKSISTVQRREKKEDCITIVHPNTLRIFQLKCLRLRKALLCTLVFKAVTVPSLVHCWEHCLKRRIRLFSFRRFYTNLHQALGLNLKCSSPRANRESCLRASCTD